MDESAPPLPADDPAELLRRAATVLHRIALERPWRPWLWGDPELDDRELGEERGGLTEPHHGHRPRTQPTHPRLDVADTTGPAWWEDSSENLGPATPRLRPPLHAGPRPATGPGSVLAEPLADLLDVLAARLGSDTEPARLEEGTTRAAMAVAAAVLRASAPPRA